LHEPKIILFDEANSSVDKVGDTYLQAALDRLKGHRTMIIISQRPSLLRMTQNVYQLSMGTLVERTDDGAPGAPPKSGQPLRQLI
jgi:ATP-binding cassette subfamily C protein LapB